MKSRELVKCASLALVLNACAFEDPAKLPDPPRDECQEGSGEPDTLYAAYADNPAVTPCDKSKLPAGAENTVLYFTGPGWSRAGAQCRTNDPFHGGLMVGKSTEVTSDRLPTTGTLAYCVVGPGSDTEYVMFSLCGVLDPAKAGCELLTQMSGIPTQFSACPGGSLCP